MRFARPSRNIRRVPVQGRVKIPSQSFFQIGMKEYVARKCAPKTAEAYSQWGQYAIAKFGDMRLQDLPAKPLVIEIALNELLDNGGRIDRKEYNGHSKRPSSGSSSKRIHPRY